MNPRYLCGILLLPHQLAQTICAHFRPFLAFASCIAWHFGLLFGGSVLLSSIHHKQTHEMSGVFLGKALAMQLYPQVQLLLCKWTAWAYSKGLYDCKLPFFFQSASIWWYQNWAPVSPIAMLHSKPSQTTIFLAVVLKLDKDSTLHLLLHRRRFRTLKKIPRREIQILTPFKLRLWWRIGI